MSRILDFQDGFESSVEPTLEILPAGAVSVTPTGNLASTNAQDALVELQSDIDTRATSTALTTHTSNVANPHAVTKTQVGLSNADNTSDVNKPVSTAQAAADAAVLSTAQSYADTKVAALVASSPATLDTLNELATALGNDPSFATTTATALGNRLRVDTAAQGLTSPQKVNAKTNVDLQNVDNTSDANKPVSTAQQAALNLKANLASPTFTGTVTVPATITSGSAVITLPTATSTVATRAGTEALTNKDIDGGTASNTSRITLPKAAKTTLDALTRKAGTILFDTTSGKPYYDDGSSLQLVGSGSGGATNFITNGDAETGTTGWTSYWDGEAAITISNASPAVITIGNTAYLYAGAPVAFNTSGTLPTGLTANTTYYVSAVTSSTTFKVSATLGGADVNTSSAGSGIHNYGPIVPVRVTGGSVGSFVLSTSSTNPLDGSNSFLITKSGSSGQATGAGFFKSFTVAPAYRGKVVQISADYLVSSGTFTAGTQPTSNSDITCWIHDGTSFIQPSSYVLNSNSSTVASRFTATFQTSATATTYKIILHQALSNANNYVLQLDNIAVSPSVYVYGSPVTDWQSYTPSSTQGFGTLASQSFFWRRVGDAMEIQGRFTTGTSSSTEGRIALPNGLTVDSTKIPSTRAVGEWLRGLVDATEVSYYVLAQPGVSYLNMGRQSSGSSPLTVTNGNNVANSGETATFKASVPILGWSSSVQMSNETDTRVVAASIHANATSTFDATVRTVTFGAASTDTHAGWNGTTTYTCIVPGLYNVRVSLCYYSTGSPSNIRIYLNKNGSPFSQNLHNIATNVFATIKVDGIVELKSGDTLNVTQIAPSQSSFVAETSLNYFEVQRISGPATIAASEEMNLRYAGTTGAAIATGATSTIVFNNKTYDTHGLYNSTTGILTAQTNCKLKIFAQIVSSSATTNGAVLIIVKNGATFSSGAYCVAVGGASIPIAQDTVPMLSGDTLRIDLYNSNAATFTPLTTGAGIILTIERVK